MGIHMDTTRDSGQGITREAVQAVHMVPGDTIHGPVARVAGPQIGQPEDHRLKPETDHQRNPRQGRRTISTTDLRIVLAILRRLNRLTARPQPQPREKPIMFIRIGMGMFTDRQTKAGSSNRGTAGRIRHNSLRQETDRVLLTGMLSRVSVVRSARKAINGAVAVEAEEGEDAVS